MKNALTEARCKIIWGESPESVKEYLIESDLSKEQVEEALDTLLEERYASIKENGIRKLAKAIVFLAILGALIYLLCIAAMETSSTYRISKGIAPLLGITGVAFVWNLWKGIDAIFEITDPSRHKGDVGISSE